MSIENCPNVIIEIGPGNLFELDKVTIDRSKSPDGMSASCTIQLNSATALPQPPQLAAIISSDRATTYFNGLYLDQSVSFSNNAQTRQYDVKLQSLYPFTRFKPIFNYRGFLTLEQHLAALLIAGGCYTPANKLNLLTWDVQGLKETTLSDLFVFETANTRFHFSFEEGFLSDALDNLASLVGAYWLVRANHWRVKALKSVKIGIGLGVVLFVLNDKEDDKARRIFAFNGGDQCNDKIFYDTLSYSNSFPLVTQETVYGVNGRPPQEDDNPVTTSDPSGKILLSSSKSKLELITRDIIQGSVRQNYDYPETITRLISATLNESTGTL